MKINVHITNDESGLCYSSIFFGGLVGLLDSFVEIISLGRVSTDFRLQLALYYARKEFEKVE